MKRVLFFTANYCGMCRALKSTLVEPLRSRGIEVEEIDCMREPCRAESHGIKKLPTTIILGEDGEVYARYEGIATVEVVEMHVRDLDHQPFVSEFAQPNSITKLA